MKKRPAKRTKRSLLTKTALAFNLIAATSLLLSYLAGFIDPASFWPGSFFGLAYPWLLLINSIFILFWLFKRPKLAGISAVAILLGYNLILNTIGFRDSTAIGVPKSSQSFIRVMTYNVHYFKKFDYQTEKFIKDEMLYVIKQEQPDVICLQEFMTRGKGEFNTLKSVKKILQTNHYYFEPTVDNGYEAQGLAIFSKYPIKHKGRLTFPNTIRGNEAIFIDVQTGKNTARVYNVHLQSIAFQPEDYRYLKQVTRDIKDVQSPRRIGSRLKQAFIRRSEQAKLLKSHTDSCKLPLVIAGDFNDTPASFAVNLLSKNLKNAFKEKGSGFGITYNGDFPNFQIDYILTSSNFDVKSYRIIDKKISDHYAVRSDLELRSP